MHLGYIPPEEKVAVMEIKKALYEKADEF